jgi:hypothetical protein
MRAMAELLSAQLQLKQAFMSIRGYETASTTMKAFSNCRLVYVRSIDTTRMAGLHSSALYASNTTIPRKTRMFFGPGVGLYLWPLS